MNGDLFLLSLKHNQGYKFWRDFKKISPRSAQNFLIFYMLLLFNPPKFPPFFSKYGNPPPPKGGGGYGPEYISLSTIELNTRYDLRPVKSV